MRIETSTLTFSAPNYILNHRFLWKIKKFQVLLQWYFPATSQRYSCESLRNWTWPVAHLYTLSYMIGGRFRDIQKWSHERKAGVKLGMLFAQKILRRKVFSIKTGAKIDVSGYHVFLQFWGPRTDDIGVPNLRRHHPLVAESFMVSWSENAFALLVWWVDMYLYMLYY